MAQQIKKRITPVAVAQPAAVSNSLLGAELPLDVGPAPDQGDVRAAHPTLGAGRRVWVDIQDSWEVKFKQVLRQQGLDYNTWKHEQDQQYSTFHKSLHGEDAGRSRPNLITGMLQRVQGMYQNDDSEDIVSEEDKDGSDEEGEGDDDDGADDGSSDDAEEGAAGDGEIDLDKEAEVEAARKKPKRQRFEHYDHDFIDDSEIEKVKGGPKVKTVHTGFYVNRGSVEVIETGSKPRQRRPPKPPAAATATAAGSKPPAKRRKQEQPLPSQPEQQQQPAATKGRKKAKKTEAGQEDQAGEGSEPVDTGGKKKRGRSEPAGAGAVDAAAGAPSSKRARKASPAVSDAAPVAAAAPPLPAPPAGGRATVKGVAAAAVAAARAALAAAKKAPASGAPVRSSSPSGRNTGKSKLPAAAAADEQAEQAAQQQQPLPRRVTPMQVAAVGEAAAGPPAAAIAAAFPGSGSAGGREAEAAGDAVEELAAPQTDDSIPGGGQPAPAGLPEEIVAAAAALQEAVQQNEAVVSGPSAGHALRNKAVGLPLLAVGLAFARLPEVQRQQHTPQLLAHVKELLPNLSDNMLRKKLLTEPRDKLQVLQDHRATLLQLLEGMRGGAGGGGGEGSASDDDFQQDWSQQAEDALLAAWDAAKALGEQERLQQLAVDACAALGNNTVQDQPDKAVAELQQVVTRTKKRQKAAKDALKAAAAVQTAGGAQQQEQPEKGASQGAGTHQQTPQGVKQALARRASPAPPAEAATQAEGRRVSQDSETATEGAGTDQDAARGGEVEVAAPADASTQQTKVEFSQWSAPSPRLERCIAAAKAAGADEDWLQNSYQSIRKGTTHPHQVFRILCHAGPGGCSVKDFKAVVDANDLGLQLDYSSKGQHHIKAALQAKGMCNIVGITEADHSKHALLCFPGVQQRAPKSSRGATPAQSVQGDGTQAPAAGAVPAAAAVAE